VSEELTGYRQIIRKNQFPYGYAFRVAYRNYDRLKDNQLSALFPAVLKLKNPAFKDDKTARQ
jgi:hypothetical protein